MDSEQWPPDAPRMAKLWVGEGVPDMWALIADLELGVQFEMSLQRSKCIFGTHSFFLYAGCPTSPTKITPTLLERLAKTLILISPHAPALASIKYNSEGLVGIAERALIAHTSIPPAFSLAAACARPDLIVIAHGIWHAVRNCDRASEIEKAVNVAVMKKWVCEPYGPFLPFIMHACYSIGTGFTETYSVDRCDLCVRGNTVGFIVMPRDKAMLVLLCAASRTVPVDTPDVLKHVWSLLKSYI